MLKDKFFNYKPSFSDPFNFYVDPDPDPGSALEKIDPDPF